MTSAHPPTPTRRARRALAIGALAGVALLLPGCFGKTTGEKEKVLALLRSTQQKPSSYLWTETGDFKLAVKGITEDDLRYAGTASIEGTDVVEEKAIDDAIMVKVDAPDRLPTSTGVGDTAVPAGQPGAGKIPEQAIRAGSWIIDPDAAPGVAARKTTTTTQLLDDGLGPRGGPIKNRDAVLEANQYLAKVVTYVTAAPLVTKFNIESPDYRPREDPFPHPKGGEIRYDIKRSDLPKAASDGKAASADDKSGKSNEKTGPPSMDNFRKLSIYVKDGEITKISERVELDERAEETARLLDTILKDAKVKSTQLKSFDAAVAKGGDSRNRAIAIAIDLVGRSPGQTYTPFRFYTLEYSREALPDDQQVTLPDDLVLGDLTKFFSKADANGQVATAPTTTPSSIAVPVTTPA